MKNSRWMVATLNVMNANQKDRMEHALRHAPAPSPNPGLLEKLKSDIYLPSPPEPNSRKTRRNSIWSLLISRWPTRFGVLGSVAALLIAGVLFLPATGSGIDLASFAKAMRAQPYHVQGKVRADYAQLLNSPLPDSLEVLERQHPWEHYEGWATFDERGQLNRLRLHHGQMTHRIKYPLERIETSTESEPRVLLNSRPHMYLPNAAQTLDEWLEGEKHGRVKITVHVPGLSDNLRLVEAVDSEDMVDRVWLDEVRQIAVRRQLVVRNASKEVVVMDVRFDSFGEKFDESIFAFQIEPEVLRKLGATPELIAQIDKDKLPVTLSGNPGAEFGARIRESGRVTEVRGRLPQTILVSAYGKTASR